ncbi:glycosyltransferase family 2 protein, partial [Chloroflexota bacterium]
MNKPLVSIVLPSLRPIQLAECLASIHRYTVGIDYEVVVISPFNIDPHPNVVYVKEDKPEGVYRAVARGYERAEGEYIIHIPDDCWVTPNWLTNMISFMKPHDDEIFIGSFRRFNVKEERVEQGHYGKLIAPFICIRRDKVYLVGSLMDCHYRSFWGDPDLSLRVWHNGGRVETCPDAWIYYPDRRVDKTYESSYNNYFTRDKEAFISRWYPIFGRPVDTPLGHQQPLEPSVLPDSLPPEQCAKLYFSLRRKDWKIVRETITSEDSTDCVYS